MNEQTQNDGGHAFPTIYTTEEVGNGYKGMSLRDYFAAHAMAAMLSNPANYGSSHEWRDDATVSEQAYEIADDMLKARAAK